MTASHSNPNIKLERALKKIMGLSTKSGWVFDKETGANRTLEYSSILALITSQRLMEEKE